MPQSQPGINNDLKNHLDTREVRRMAESYMRLAIRDSPVVRPGGTGSWGTRLAYWTRVKWFAEETRYHMIPGAPLCSSLQMLGTPRHEGARC